MRAVVLESTLDGAGALRLAELPDPRPGPGQVLLRVHACGACRTDLHILDGELPPHRRPLVLGHQIVGTVVALGPPAGGGVDLPAPGERLGVPWLAWTCGVCSYCQGGRENLCPRARFTGYDVDGGFAELAVADARYCFPIPPGIEDAHAAPLLCAGLIGYRTLRFAGDARRLGIYGFGAAAHIVLQVARAEGRSVVAFTRPGDVAAQRFALALGAAQALDSTARPDEPLDAALLFAPAGETVPAALAAVRPGGVVVCGGIHMSDIPSFPYELLWGERVLRSVANLTRQDGKELLELAPRIPVRTEITTFPLALAADALDALRAGRVHGAAVIVP